jgi:heme A synthase
VSSSPFQPSGATPAASTAAADPRRAARFRRLAWWLLAYNLLVVAWGAFVRATGSGAGCGAHWPLCNGEVVPRAPSAETLIELSHRLTSGLDGLLVLGLVVLAFRWFPRRHPVRTAVVLGFFFLLVEGAIGAGLVLFEMVAANESIARAWWMAAHLVNTFILLGMLTLTALWARPEKAEAGGTGREGTGRARRFALVFAARDPAAWLLAGAFAGMLVLGASGGVAALGDTLFPAASFREGLAQDFSPTAHLLVRLRVLHPVLALGVGVYLVAAAMVVAALRPVTPAVRRAAHLVAGLFVAQIAVGLVNLALAAPVWLQLVHLLMADLVWIALVVLADAALAPRAVPRPAGAAAAALPSRA